MPTVRILQSVAGLNFSWVAGDEIEMTDEKAAAWNDGVRGELVETGRPAPPETPEVVEVPERAVAEVPETPEAPRRRGPGRPRRS
ncbi:hypothetical protein ABZ342_44500 [Amycolatopsis sp. NPDC005961]|uniref:hypothetical protein n=1 Tax=Amycolatopsis sp. NPDC005961 TaxID=3156720 RepID=UPI0033CD1827